MRSIRRLDRPLVLALVTTVLGCNAQAVAKPKPAANTQRALFVGNSYLYEMDIPGIVQALADSAHGNALDVSTVAGPDMALIDHWVSGDLNSQLASGPWDWVVLQQGPSSVEVNRDTLRLAASLFATKIKAVGARVALFSAWPAADRRQDFPRAIESYSLAAGDVGGLLLPVASGWLAAWDRDPGLPLYSDGLHPSAEGAYLAALVVYARLMERSPSGLPATLRLHSGAVLAIPPMRALVLQQAAEAVLAER